MISKLGTAFCQSLWGLERSFKNFSTLSNKVARVAPCALRTIHTSPTNWNSAQTNKPSILFVSATEFSKNFSTESAYVQADTFEVWSTGAKLYTKNITSALGIVTKYYGQSSSDNRFNLLNIGLAHDYGLIDHHNFLNEMIGPTIVRIEMYVFGISEYQKKCSFLANLYKIASFYQRVQVVHFALNIAQEQDRFYANKNLFFEPSFDIGITKNNHIIVCAEGQNRRLKNSLINDYYTKSG